MLYLNVTYTMPKEHRESFLADIVAQDIPARTRKERGNHAYDFSVPLERDNQVYLREIWDDDALEEHKKSANIKLLGAMKEKYGIETVLTISHFD